MIRFFSDIKAGNVLFLLLFLLSVRVFFLVGYLGEIPVQETESESYVAFVFSLLNVSPLVSFLLSTVLVYLSALLLNNLLIQHEILFQRNFLGAYFYCLLTSVFTEYFFLGSSIFINLFIILFFHRLFELYKAPYPIDNIFLSGLLLGLCVLFSLSYAVVFLYLIVGIAFFRTLNNKEIFAAFLGFLLPAFLGMALHFLVNGVFLPDYLRLPSFRLTVPSRNLLFSPLVVVAVIGVLASLRIVRNFWRNTNKTRGIIQLLYLYLGLTVFLSFSGKEPSVQETILMALPLSIILAHYFTVNHKLGLTRKVLHWTLLVSVLVFQYRFLWE